ncbi:MAG: LLM class flavin-dependent oxidoreductase, partial [Actinobacteria bacterium]|nr:LLM class flavin-dependent oxidoreductase [Actinomycetota bacterium]
MTRPFRVSVMQPTMEPIEELLAYARAIDSFDFHTIWMAENYPWWRKHSMEARSATAQSTLVAKETSRVTIGWGIITPYSRHPVEIAMEARVMQEVAPDRFFVGLGASMIFMRQTGQAAGQSDRKPRPGTAIREAVEIVRGVMEGGEFELSGKEFSAYVPALKEDTESPRGAVPIYVAGTGPKMQQIAGQVGDALLTASISTPAFMPYARGNMDAGAKEAGRDPEKLELGATCISSIGDDADSGSDGAREFAAMYLANKVQNIRGQADVLLEKAGLTQEEIRPIAEAMEKGGRLAAKEKVTREILRKCKPIAGTPSECIERIEEFKAAGCDHVMLELWGGNR